jgi:guanylate kinase
MKSFPYPRSGFAGSLLMVVAPSGAGKSSLVKALLQKIDQIELSISYTTRSPRSGEQHGREYHFVNLTEFQRMEQAGEFLEHAEVHGNRYGTSRAWIEQRLGQGVDVLLEIDWQGAQQVRERFADDPRVGITGIFILPPSFETALDDLVSIVRAARTRYSAQHARHRRLFAQLGLGGENS